MNHLTMIRNISLLSSILVGLLALFCFTLSFEALRDLAVTLKVAPQHLAWLFPLVVDGAIVIFSLSALRASLREESSIWLRGLVVVSTAGSVLFNISHVPDSNWLSQLYAAMPPVLLFCSFEALMHSIHQEMKFGFTQEKEEAEKPLTKEERKSEVARLIKAGMQAQEIVEVIPNVSLRTIQRDIGALVPKN